MAQYSASGETTSKFHSALDEYLARLGRVYDPIVVQSQEEFGKQLTDLSFEHSLAVKTLILPRGVTLSDPRLHLARVKSGRSYVLPRGQTFLTPNPCYVADLDEQLIPPAEGPYYNTETRYQVIGQEKIPEATHMATATHRMSLYHPEPSQQQRFSVPSTPRRSQEAQQQPGMFGRLKGLLGLKQQAS